MTPATDPDWAAEDAAYWRAHRPAYLPQQQRTRPLPPPPFPLGVRFAVGPTAAPLPPIVAPPPPPTLETLLEPPPARWLCAECGGPRRTARSTKCQTCTAKAANAVRWPKPPAAVVEPEPEPPPARPPTLDALVATLAKATRRRAMLADDAADLETEIAALATEIATLETEIARRLAARNLPTRP